MHRTQRTLAAAAALSLALLVSACGTSGGSDAGGKDDGKDTTTTEATSTTASADDGAQARADSVDLEESDFPDGWTSSPASADDEDSPMKACDPSFSDEDAKLAKHSTDDFTTGSLDDADGSVFSAETVVFADADTAENLRLYERFVAPALEPEVRAFWVERGFALTTDNAQAMVLASQAALHYSPEPKVIGKLIQSARLTGNEALAQWHETQQQKVYGAKAD